MARSKIEWLARPGTAPESWNPVSGCEPNDGRQSEACINCYARRMARRLAGRCGYPAAPHHFDVTLHADRLKEPLRWQKRRTVFVCSMGDLFHASVPFDFVTEVYRAMIACQGLHTFVVLTKRPSRMLAFYESCDYLRSDCYKRHPYPDIWPGVSVENQQRADERIPLLLETPAAVHVLSAEPLLGPLDLRKWLRPRWIKAEHKTDFSRLSWCITGGESGRGARPMDPKWARMLYFQTRSAHAAYFHKQNGEWLHESQFEGHPQGAWPTHIWPDASWSHRVGRKAAGHLLDGREHREWPEVAR